MFCKILIAFNFGHFFLQKYVENLLSRMTSPRLPKVFLLMCSRKGRLSGTGGEVWKPKIYFENSGAEDPMARTGHQPVFLVVVFLVEIHKICVYIYISKPIEFM